MIGSIYLYIQKIITVVNSNYYYFLIIHIENINLLFSEKAGILKCAVGFICKNMDVDIMKSSYKSILINAYCLILYAKQKMHSTLPTNYLPTYLLYELLSHVGNNNFKLNELEKKKLQYFELIEPVL